MRLFEQWKVKTIIKAECFLSCCRFFWSEKHKNYLLSKPLKWNSKVIAPTKTWMECEKFALTNFLPSRKVQKKTKNPMIDMNFIWFTYFEAKFVFDEFLCLDTAKIFVDKCPPASAGPEFHSSCKTLKLQSLYYLQTTPNSSSLSWLKDI